MSKPELALYGSNDGTGRAYRHPFRTHPDGKPVDSPSVTTVLNLVEKGKGLAQWAVNQTLDWMVENLSLLYTKDHEASKRWGKYRWKDSRDLRAEVGTGIHETIESLHTGGWNYPALDEEQQKIMQQWEAFNERYEVTPIRSEFTIWNLKADYAGTADGLWDVTDRKSGETWHNLLIDLKTSNSVWPDYWMQLAALSAGDVIMEKQEDGKWIEVPNSPDSGGLAIIHLKADKWEFLVEDDKEMIDLYYRQFLEYRNLWSIQKAVEEKLKAREVDNVPGF